MAKAKVCRAKSRVFKAKSKGVMGQIEDSESKIEGGEG